MNEFLVECKNVYRYFSGVERVAVLKGIDFYLKSTEAVAIEGASGSGKSTLLLLLAGLDFPSGGELRLFGRAISEMRPREVLRLRNQLVGVIYQYHHLLPEFSIVENVAMPLLIRGMEKAEALTRAEEIVGRVGLENRKNHRSSQLSGGECQRAAIARALVVDPKLILADEPTGNLDGANAEIVSQLLLELCKENQTAVVVATHDAALSAKMNKQFILSDGKLTRKT